MVACVLFFVGDDKMRDWVLGGDLTFEREKPKILDLLSLTITSNTRYENKFTLRIGNKPFVPN